MIEAPALSINYHYSRPQQIRGYEKQRAFIDAPQRYAIVEASTKAGKTTGCIVWLFEEALKPIPGKKSKSGCNYWWVAPVYGQADIAFRRMKRYIKPQDFYVSNESKLTITLKNGAIIAFKSGADPDNLYGEDVYAVVVDEASRVKKDSWFAIRSTLTATQGRCRMIGNVKGTGNWFYELARKAETKDPDFVNDWAYFKITAADAVKAGTIKQEELEDAKRTLPEGIFLELYYGIPFVNSSNKFAYAFNEKKHVKDTNINYDYPVYLSFDFNKNPICCGIYQYYGNTLHIPYIIKLENSDIYKLCEHIKNMFVLYDPEIIVTGDASGNSRSAMVRDNLTYFRIIMNELQLPRSAMKQSTVNPSIEQNQVLVNAVLQHINHAIDPNNAQGLIFDLKFVEMLPDGSIKKGDRNDPKQQADALDTYRYFVNHRFRKDFLKGVKQ